MSPSELFVNVERVEMTNEEYHSSPWMSLSKTRLTDFAEDPQLFYQRYITGELAFQSSDALVFGIAYHESVLEHKHAVSAENFMEGSLAVFRPCGMPGRKPDIESEDEQIWIVEMPEPGVVRKSAIWGDLEDERSWHVSPDPGGEEVLGFCAFEDMLQDGLAIRHIPEYALSGTGKKQGKRWESWRDEHAGETCYKPNEWCHILGMRRILRSHGDAHRCLYQGGEAEASFVGTCAITGLEIRTRVDWHKREPVKIVATDLKSTRDAVPRKWEKQAVNGDLHVQGCIIAGMLGSYYGDMPVEVVFVAQEKEPIYRTETFECEAELMEIACERYQELVLDFQKHVDSGVWLRDEFGKRQKVHAQPWQMQDQHFRG